MPTHPVLVNREGALEVDVVMGLLRMLPRWVVLENQGVEVEESQHIAASVAC